MANAIRFFTAFNHNQAQSKAFGSLFTNNPSQT